MSVTEDLAQWTRLSGTAEERAAAEYLAAELTAFGFTARIIKHDAYISLPGKAALRITSPRKRDVACITHSMGVATDAKGVDGDLVYVGKGRPDDYARHKAAGKFALVDGRATPQLALDATRAGARGLVCISGRIPHEMCCSPVWGSPSETTVGDLPNVIIVSVAHAEGEWLPELCRRGGVAIHVTASVDTRWRQTPIVHADLQPSRADAEPSFVMLSGHLDSWYLGAMDNGTANAAMLEVARLVAAHREGMRRGLRVLFWSGHSHGRYSSSAWYADNFFDELDQRCVIHVNADSLGALNADDLATNSMPETAPLVLEAAQRVARAKVDAHRVGRNSDQSFLGIGIPTVLGSLSRQKDKSLGWWWHTPEDTLDKIDPDRLVRDAKIFLYVVERLVGEPVLPLDYAASAADIAENLNGLQRIAGDRFDLSGAIEEAARLERLAVRLQVMARTQSVKASPERINACLRELGRILIPATYTAAGRHAHDPALDVPFLPKLQGVRRLAAVAAQSDAAKLLTVDLVRARNEIANVLRRACAVVEACLEASS